jgi:hypothetical protein
MANRYGKEYRLPHDGSVIRPEQPKDSPYSGRFMENPFSGGPKSPYDWRSPDGDESQGGSKVARKPKPKNPSGSSAMKVPQ